MKRILSIAIAGAVLSALALPSSGVLPFNYKDRSLSASVVQDMERIGAVTPPVNEVYSNAFGTDQWRGNLEDTGERKIVRKDEKFSNSGLAWTDNKKSKLGGTTCSSVAKAEVQLCLVMCKPTGVAQWIKRDCLNVAGKRQLPKTPHSKQVCEEVVEPAHAGTIGIDIDVSANATATAIVNNDIDVSASNGPMTFNFFQPSAAPTTPLHDWRGQTTVTENQIIAWFWQPRQRPTSIEVNNTNINENNIANANVLTSNQVQNLVNGNGSTGTAGGTATGPGNVTAGGGRSP
ncbi:MAG: hypothetical protein Q7K33_00875 [Candidatus Berkelbacteria bacterium]|nr:hypothetical protein [Candidatus Berkelbacteria bacterium]